METEEIEHLKDRVSCAAVLEKAGFSIDVKESTRRAVKHRRGDAIVIVIHGGQGWFDPLSEAKGDVFSLIQRLDGVGFRDALVRAADLIGFVPAEPVRTRPQRDRASDMSIAARWQSRRKPWPGSATWRYLRDERCLPETVLHYAIRQGRLREGPHGEDLVSVKERDDGRDIPGEAPTRVPRVERAEVIVFQRERFGLRSSIWPASRPDRQFFVNQRST